MARKFKSYRNSYGDGSVNIKKILLIVGAAVLGILLIAAISVGIFLATLSLGDEPQREPTFYVQTMPEKTTYMVGDFPVWSGFTAVLTTASGNSITLGIDNCTFTGFDSSAPAEEQVITVTYKEFSDTFTITIMDESQLPPPDRTFTGKMSFQTVPKTEYKVGENLSIEGGVLLLEYEDGTEEVELTTYMLDGFFVDGSLNPTFTTYAPGTFNIQVSYLEDAKWAYAYYRITVTE